MKTGDDYRKAARERLTKSRDADIGATWISTRISREATKALEKLTKATGQTKRAAVEAALIQASREKTS